MAIDEDRTTLGSLGDMLDDFRERFAVFVAAANAAASDDEPKLRDGVHRVGLDLTLELYDIDLAHRVLAKRVRERGASAGQC
ncbi:MAG: hypothetical protein AAF580_05930 [Pseudomonadota bacterium]